MIEFCTHEKHGCVCALTEGYCNLGACQYEELKEFAPLRHGRWTMSNDRPDTIICSCCGNAFDVWKADIKRHNYCPNCGARMGGDKNE